MSATLRLPLATGASALQHLAIPVGIFQVLAFGPLFFATKLPGWTVFPIALLWVVWFFGTIGALMEAWKRRASDVALSAEGIAVLGGPSRGLRLRWDALAAGPCEVREQTAEGATTWTLILDGREVAVTGDPAERRSFEAIVDTVRAGGLGGAASAAPAPSSPDVLLCDHCGAPAAPRDEDHVRCRSCGADVAIPASLREQLAGLTLLESSRRRSEALLGVLLRQRGAGFTNLLFAAATPPLLVGWPLCAILFDEFYQTRHLFRWNHGLGLFVCATAFTYGLSLLVQGQLVGRAALRLVALRFRAVPPAREGDPSACRRCGAPLAGAPEQLVVLCAYCRAENITGVDLGPQAEVEEQQAEGLGATLEGRLRERRRWRWLSLLAAALFALGAWTLHRTFLGTCRDGVTDGDETDVDCGGSCTRCEPSGRCGEGADCRSGICREGRCAAPTCSDGVRNGDESSTDCGGGTCPKCEAGRNCNGASDCRSGRCELGGECGKE